VLSHHVDRKPVTIAAYTIAGTVLLQRITSDSHWPSDVFTGATYGWVISHGLLGMKEGRKVSVVPFDCGGARGLAVRVVF
jgi:membrane-associated phospholipid phosphatase